MYNKLISILSFYNFDWIHTGINRERKFINFIELLLLIFYKQILTFKNVIHIGYIPNI